MINALNWFESNSIINIQINVVYAMIKQYHFMSIMDFMLEIIF